MIGCREFERVMQPSSRVCSEQRARSVQGVDRPTCRHPLRRAPTRSSNGPWPSGGTTASGRRGKARIPRRVESGGRHWPRTLPRWTKCGVQTPRHVARRRHQGLYADECASRGTSSAPSLRRSTMAPRSSLGSQPHRSGVARAKSLLRQCPSAMPDDSNDLIIQ